MGALSLSPSQAVDGALRPFTDIPFTERPSYMTQDKLNSSFGGRLFIFIYNTGKYIHDKRAEAGMYTSVCDLKWMHQKKEQSETRVGPWANSGEVVL